MVKTCVRHVRPRERSHAPSSTEPISSTPSPPGSQPYTPSPSPSASLSFAVDFREVPPLRCASHLISAKSIRGRTTVGERKGWRMEGCACVRECSRESDVRTAKTQSEERCGMKLPRAESHSQEQPYWTDLTARLPDRLGANTTHAIVKSTKEKCPSVGRRTPRTRNKVRRERLSTMVRKDVEEREDFREGDRHRHRVV